MNKTMKLSKINIKALAIVLIFILSLVYIVNNAIFADTINSASTLSTAFSVSYVRPPGETQSFNMNTQVRYKLSKAGQLISQPKIEDITNGVGLMGQNFKLDGSDPLRYYFTNVIKFSEEIDLRSVSLEIEMLPNNEGNYEYVFENTYSAPVGGDTQKIFQFVNDKLIKITLPDYPTSIVSPTPMVSKIAGFYVGKLFVMKNVSLPIPSDVGQYYGTVFQRDNSGFNFAPGVSVRFTNFDDPSKSYLAPSSFSQGVINNENCPAIDSNSGTKCNISARVPVGRYIVSLSKQDQSSDIQNGYNWDAIVSEPENQSENHKVIISKDQNSYDANSMGFASYFILIK